ncbi:protein FREE1-like isoform X2 [Phragmites australis]|uniref:protein FREE1-like isoform X2 n=1 Tax=Phragmites australis TaxID=29695 RepID=UPI002D78A71F|nr:protein FREE1-like isoform X2 [Phragmites australis]
MHPAGAGDYSPYYAPYPSPAAAAPPPSTYPSVSASASAPPYSPYPTDFAPPASYSAYPPAPPADLPHYAPPAAAPPPPPPQPYYPYEPPPLPPSPHNPAPSPYPSVDRAGSYGYGSGAGSGYGQELYPPKPAGGGGWSDDGAYAYDGGDAPEPYGARGIAPRSGSALFDDYGRSIGSATDRGGRGGSAASLKVVRAVPKAETSEDVRGGVQKFRVKLLPEGAGSPMDVLCQVGLDGIRMLDPNTSRTLRIYPLETVTRWDVLDSSIFAFWSKSSVDVEARRIRLKSNSYTSNTILDTVTAASVQFKEMGGGSISRSRAVADAAKPAEQQNERKKNFLDWRNLMKPMIEEKDHWVPDEAVSKCIGCAADFSAFNRRHHCRNCGDIFCDKCTQGRTPLTTDADAQPVRVCDRCMAEVSQRLSNAREAANRPIVHSHEDLAKKLQEAMDINKRSSSGTRSSDGSGKRMREVACPVCTVHLQIDILKRLQRQAFYDIMQLRERQEKVERVLSLYKATKGGPFAEESTLVKGIINVAGSLARDSSESYSGISSRFVFETTIHKKDSLFAELVADHRYMSQENDHIGSPLVLSKVMYLSNINDSFSVAAVPIGARCDDFSTDPNLREEHWLASLRSSLRPPLLIKSHKYAGGLIFSSKNIAASFAQLISSAGKPGEASRVFTGFGQISYQMPHDIKLTMSAAWRGLSSISRTSKPTTGGCIDFELKIDEDSRIGAWIEVNKKSNSRSLICALTLSDTPEDNLGWGVSLRRGTEAKPQRFQVEGFLNIHLGKKAALKPGIVFNVDGRRCTPGLVFQSSWSL